MTKKLNWGLILIHSLPILGLPLLYWLGKPFSFVIAMAVFPLVVLFAKNDLWDKQAMESVVMNTALFVYGLLAAMIVLFAGLYFYAGDALLLRKFQGDTLFYSYYSEQIIAAGLALYAAFKSRHGKAFAYPFFIFPPRLRKAIFA